MDQSEGESPPPQKEKKYLSVREAAFIGVGSMVGAGIFALLGAAGAVAGAAVWLSFLIAGAITAWLVCLANAIVTAMVAVSFGSYASSVVTGEESAVRILTVFAVVTLVNIHPSLLAPLGYPLRKDIISSVALTFCALLGFGIITFTAKDLRKPSRQLPRAMFIALSLPCTRS